MSTGARTQTDGNVRQATPRFLNRHVWETQITTHGPLQGLHVIEVSAFVAAPLGGMTLTKLGVDTHI